MAFFDFFVTFGVYYEKGTFIFAMGGRFVLGDVFPCLR